MSEAFFDRLSAALSGPLPGRDAQRRMAPAWRSAALEPRPDYRNAAVLILLYEEDGGFRFPLIVRSAGPGPHGGQVALPGGGLESGEGDAEAALREAREELGIESGGIRVLGKLTPFGVSASRYRVTAVVARADSPPRIVPAPAEVADWFPAPLEALADGSARGEAAVRHDGADRTVPCYRLSGRIVWGATAVALAELEAVVAGSARR